MSAVIIHPGHVRIINKARDTEKFTLPLQLTRKLKEKINPELNYYQKRNPYVFKEC